MYVEAGFFIAAENDKSSVTFWVIIMEAFLALKKPQRRAPVIVLMWGNPKCPKLFHYSLFHILHGDKGEVRQKAFQELLEVKH